MMGYGYGMGASGWIAMTIFWVGLITLVVWTVSRAATWRGRDENPPIGGGGGGARATAEDILDRRFAAGELDEETYRSMRATLPSSQATRDEPR